MFCCIILIYSSLNGHVSTVQQPSRGGLTVLAIIFSCFKQLTKLSLSVAIQPIQLLSWPQCESFGIFDCLVFALFCSKTVLATRWRESQWKTPQDTQSSPVGILAPAVSEFQYTLFSYLCTARLKAQRDVPRLDTHRGKAVHLLAAKHVSEKRWRTRLERQLQWQK